jgi:predicted Zn-dependent peptidase
MLFDGTTKRPSHREFNHVIDFHGGKRNGMTSLDRVMYFVRIASDKTEVAFDYLSDQAQNALLREEDIEKERHVIGEEIKRTRDELRRHLGWLSYPLLYGDDFVGTTFLNQPLESFTQGILRDLYRKGYGSQNFVLSLVGPVDEHQALDLAERHFSGLSEGEELRLAAPQLLTENRIKVASKDVSQAGIQISLPSVGTADPLYLRHRLFSIVLGTGPTSRIPLRIRHKDHLAYSVGADHAAQYDAGYIRIYAAMDEARLLEGYAAIREELGRAAELTEAEFTRAKNILASELIFDEDRFGQRQERHCYELLFHGEISPVQEYLEEVEAIRIDELRKCAAELVNSPYAIAVVTNSLSEADFE